ncbi:hypothetical protein BCR44DRAFT_1423090 [Catenaria anguillulae PL171]|uniref:Uncharacterized protein n=1 Tax=Catenaria anguillulae PL171 TaxID=765915 RepID=A0A1Y2I681_9FUNG|nr:hypothetical protein BCR44DRAFT_1423090 [Catenaria anguillulae PL171]
MACSVPKIKLAVVEFLWQHLPAESKSDINASPAYVAASRAGRVDLLDYLQTLGLGWEDDTVEHATTAAVVLSVLEWWFERKPAWNVHTVRLVLSDASARGDVASLQWMLEVGLLKHDVANTPVFADGTLSRMLDDAFVSRSIDTLDWWQAFLASDGFDADSCDMSQADIQAKFSELLNVAIAVNWTDHVVWAHKHGHILKLDSSCLISSQQGADAFDKCLELYHDGMAAGPSTNWKALGIRDPTEWAKSGIEIACRAGNLQALELYWHCSAVVRDGRGYYGLKEASELGHIHVLHWWLDKKLPLANNEVSCPAAFLNPFSFDFWSRHKDQLPFTVLPPKTIQAFMSLAPEVKHIPSIAALSYAFKSGMVSIPSATFVLELTTCGLASYLEWWFVYCGRPEEAWSQLSGEAMVSATFYQWPSVLEWWKHSGIKLKVPYTHIDQVRGSSKAVAWWRASGLVEV